MVKDEIRAFFEPKSVLLVGASEIEGGLASFTLFKSIVHNMVHFYKGKTYVLDLSGKLNGAIRSFKGVPKGLDLAVLMLPPKLTLRHIRKLVDKGFKAIAVLPGGYTQEQLEQLTKITVNKRVRVLGPNSVLGVINTSNGLCISFERGIMPTKGGIALVSQSSSVGAAMLDWAWFYGIGISKFASLGDRVDVDEVTLLEHLVRDKDTKVICIYVESVKRGRKFVEAVREAMKHKPICVLKGGVSRAPPRPAISRAASFAESGEIFNAALRQAGAICARDMEELFDIAIALDQQPPMKDVRVAIISNARGPAALAADAINRERLRLAKLAENTAKAIMDRYPAADVSNPIKITSDARAEHYKFVLRQVMADQNVDGVMVISMLKSRLLEPEDLKVVVEIARKFKKKPIVNVSMGGEDYTLIYEFLKHENLPVYDTPEKAARVLRALHQYWKSREKVRK